MSRIFCSTKYTVSSLLFDCEDKSITEINGEILTCDDNQKEIVIGKVTFFYVDVLSALDDGWDLLSLLDLRSETVPYSKIYDSSDPYNPLLSPDVVKVLGKSDQGVYEDDCQIFIIDRIEILPEYRGNDLSRIVFEDGIRLFGSGAHVIALRCFPLQFESKFRETSLMDEWDCLMRCDKLNMDAKASISRLMDYYSSIGFHHIPNTDIMMKAKDL